MSDTEPSGAELSRRWAPYAKWRGTAFRALPLAGRLGPLLAGATEMSDREDNVPEGLLGGISDPAVARLPSDLGAVGQWVDSDAVLMSPGRRAGLQSAYRDWARA